MNEIGLSARLVRLVFACALLVSGCPSSSSSTHPSKAKADAGDDDAGSTGTAGSGGATKCVGGITVTGVVKEFEPKIQRQQFKAVPGVQVCVYQNAAVPCATTDSGGAFSLCGVPANSDVLLSYQKTGYAQALRMLSTRMENYDILAETAIGTLNLGIAEAGSHGVNLSTLKGGVIQFFAADPADGVLQVALLADYTAELLDLTGKPAICYGTNGDVPCAPFYLDDNGEPDMTLTQASKTGVGAFGNVKAGKYLLRIHHPTLDCNSRLPESGWPTVAMDEVEVEAIDKWVTSQVGVFCQAPE